MIISNDLDLGKKFNSAIFPGLQGGPLMHVIAGKAVAFGEALQPEFKDYVKQVVVNCQAMAKAVIAGGYDIVSGGTDSHLALIDLRPKGLKGNQAEEALERAYITCNKNGVPFDPEKPTVTSGLRVGSPAGTTRGFGEAEFTRVGELMVRVLDALVDNPEGDDATEAAVRAEVMALTGAFPIYPELA
jgi:glycine hydroxymethyltransferase